MDSFNKELINKIKIFQAENQEEDIEEKYCFIQYVFSNIESISYDSIDINSEEFEEMNCNVDALYYDEDDSVYNLYLAIYNDKIDDLAFLSKEEVQNYYDKIINFLKKAISGKFQDFDSTSNTFEIARNIFSDIKKNEIVVNIVSNYNIPSNYKKDNLESIEGYNVSFRTYDLEDLRNKFSKLTNENVELVCKEYFSQDINAIKITSSNDFDVYLFGMRGSWLAKLYKEDSARLLEQNVRSYLRRTAKVNAGILDTVKNSPEQFVSFNNGISAVATEAFTANVQGQLCSIQKIANFQIVNGGQTTATLYECLKDKYEKELSEVIVPVKMTVVKNLGNAESFIRNISVYSNTQTAIKKSDPPSNLPYYIQIKSLSRQCLSLNGDTNYICYFERTNGEYMTELRRNNSSKKFTNTNPKNMKFDKIDLARAINCWEQFPYITCQGREKNFSYFNDVVKNQITLPDETYFKEAYALVLLYRKLDKLAKKLRLTVKSNVVAYTIAYISFIYNKQLDLFDIWSRKDLPNAIINIANLIMPKINDVIFNAPKEHPEPRMWARKEECWNIIKNIPCPCIITKSNKAIEFYTKNDALIYISNNDHFHDSLTWSKLLLWNNKYHILNNSQIRMVKYMRIIADSETSLTKKQIDFLKDIFMSAVKQGYKYN